MDSFSSQSQVQSSSLNLPSPQEEGPESLRLSLLSQFSLYV